jgi:cyclophilin family peptidyl-prolyl cis-trans isomerase
VTIPYNPTLIVAAGDVEQDDGYGSISIYGKYFEDETFQVKHTAPLFVSMANIGKDTNGCQFFITTVMAPWLDGYHTAFGKVIKSIYRLKKLWLKGSIMSVTTFMSSRYYRAKIMCFSLAS